MVAAEQEVTVLQAVDVEPAAAAAVDIMVVVVVPDGPVFPAARALYQQGERRQPVEPVV